jgi:hypothetical protein
MLPSTPHSVIGSPHDRTIDVVGEVRMFEHEDDPLDGARERFGVVRLRAGV